MEAERIITKYKRYSSLFNKQWTDDIILEEDITEELSYESIQKYLYKSYGELIINDITIKRAQEILINIWLKCTGGDMTDNSMKPDKPNFLNGIDQWPVLWIEPNQGLQFTFVCMSEFSKKQIINQIMTLYGPHHLRIIPSDLNSDCEELSILEILTNESAYLKYKAYWLQ